ncbi:MAG: four helix bundle suffix domain-containing protein [Bacillota bacterium]
MEIKLINVARASLKKLLADYHDYLRTRGLRLWDKSGEALFVRKLGAREDTTYESYKPDRLLRHLEKAFLEEGGIRERMTRARLRERARVRV